jgi:hypothetical protein
MNVVFFGPTIIMVVITTIITPILLKLAFKPKKDKYEGLVQSNLVEKYEEIEYLDQVDQVILNWEADNRTSKTENKKR